MNDLTSFNKSRPFTLGVELEFQILDAGTLNLASRAPAILKDVPGHLTDRIKPEFTRSMVEVATGICPDVAAVEDDLLASIRLLESLARKQDAVIYCASLHPFADFREQQLSDGKRYGRIMDDLQITGRRLITQGMHVHVGFADGDLAILVCDRIRRFLPVLLALSASSPFYEGEDTGFFSYRSRLMDSLPRSGVPETLHDWQNFKNLLLILAESNIISNIRELWWDVRPHPDFGTLEIRICDLPSRFTEILALTALIQALAATLADDIPRQFRNREITQANKWQAARYGLEGKFLDPDRQGPVIPMTEAAAGLVEMVRPRARDLDGLRYLGPAGGIITHGTSARRQKLLYERQRDFKMIINEQRDIFWT